MAAMVVGAVLSSVTKNVVELVFKLGAKGCERWQGFPMSDIDFIRREMLMIAAAEEDHLSAKGDPSAVKSISMEEMRDLSHDIQDCLDRILRYVEGAGEISLLHRLMAVGLGAGRPPFATEVKQLKERLKAAHQRKVDYNINGGQPADASSSTSQADTEMDTETNSQVQVQLVGIDKPKQELLELLLLDMAGQPEHLKVISIVGFGGSGKSTLAKALYECPDVVRQFPCRAWVVGSDHKGNNKGFLTTLLQKLRPGDSSRSNLHQLQDGITNYLSTNRYLIVFDGIEEEQWDCIKSTLPENTGSRVIVTTKTQTVAEICCNHGNNGYVYNMRSLNEKHSKDLLQVVLKRPLLGLEQSEKLIINICDGHPLAIFSVANYLLRKREFTETDCKNFWCDLGLHMAKEYSFRKLHNILSDNYRSLPAYPVNLKTCLLYVCVFPNGHPIKKSSFMRRLLAEGYVQDTNPCKAVVVADKSLDELIDRNIIRAINPSKNAKVKAFRAHGIMHEFMLHMSMSAKFITTFRDPQRSNYRHLFMNEHPPTSSGRVSNVHHRHCCPAIGRRPGNEKLRAHSLTICGSAGEAVVDFAKCELLRVLDLEECKDLNDCHMDDIHKLWHLKFLSLGCTISRLPRQIEKLHCLETLDMRKARIEILPVQVLMLPHLAHLLGKFKLQKRNWKMSELGKFLPKESNLQTLAGFITDGNLGLPMLMVCMKRLRKVKIWCNDHQSKMLAELLAAIKKFVEDELDTSIGVRSLSLHLGVSSVHILHSLESSFGYLSSLKLHGALRGQTQFVTSLCGLTELCLSSTNNLMNNDISSLCKLIHLQYLKLVNVSLGDFIIRRRDFPRLLRLSLVQNPTLPIIEQGALRSLISLQLLNERLCDLAGIEIRRHEHLKEVALDSDLRQEAKTVWEDAAKKHPKRPTVLYLKRVYPQGTHSMVKYVAFEDECSHMHEERRINVLQSISEEEHTSSLKDVNFAGSSMPSTALYSERNGSLNSCSTRASILVEVQGLLQSSSNKIMYDQQLPVGIPLEKAKPAAQEYKGGISSNFEDSNFGALESQTNDDHGRMKEFNYDADSEDDGKDKNYKKHKSFSGYQKAMPGNVIKDTAVHGFTSAVRNTD